MYDTETKVFPLLYRLTPLHNRTRYADFKPQDTVEKIAILVLRCNSLFSNGMVQEYILKSLEKKFKGAQDTTVGKKNPKVAQIQSGKPCNNIKIK